MVVNHQRYILPRYVRAFGASITTILTNEMTFSLSGGTTIPAKDNMFLMGSSNGSVSVNHLMQLYKNHSFQLNVTVRDQHEPPHRDNTTLRV